MDHKRRQQILQAAAEHFRLYGYRKTTLPTSLKQSIFDPISLQILRFKQAIGEAICSHCLGAVLAESRNLLRLQILQLINYAVFSLV